MSILTNLHTTNIPLDISSLDSDQQSVIQSVQSGRNILITGQAGTGKSYLLNFIREHFPVAIAATTGVAAANVAGRTIHSLLKLGLGTDTPARIAADIANYTKKEQEIMGLKMIAIDEISMAQSSLIDLIDEVLRMVRGNSDPFGGVQMLFIGDFLQLPPVDKRSKTPQYAFDSKAWKDADIKTHTLTQMHRQKDKVFCDMLNRIRVGRKKKSDCDLLRSRVGVEPDPKHPPVVLHGVNREVDAYNTNKLNELKGETLTFESYDSGQLTLLNNCTLANVLEIKPDAQVMCLHNIDVEGGLVNGSVGKVVEFKSDTGEIIVDFFDYGLYAIERAEVQFKNEKGEVLASRRQYPIKLAWAFSIHKSQGMSIDYLAVSLANIFAPGQAYVALSRARKLETLYLDQFNASVINACPRALEFYENNK